MVHGVYRIVSFQVTGPHSLHVEFDDGAAQEIDFAGTLEGDIFGPLKDASLFAKAELDPEAHTLVWPNGADFDPETLHDWPKYREQMMTMARRWAGAEAKA
jgi:hypothetical protein